MANPLTYQNAKRLAQSRAGFFIHLSVYIEGQHRFDTIEPLFRQWHFMVAGAADRMGNRVTISRIDRFPAFPDATCKQGIIDNNLNKHK